MIPSLLTGFPGFEIWGTLASQRAPIFIVADDEINLT